MTGDPISTRSTCMLWVARLSLIVSLSSADGGRFSFSGDPLVDSIPIPSWFFYQVLPSARFRYGFIPFTGRIVGLYYRNQPDWRLRAWSPHVTFGYVLSQISVSSVCLSSATFVRPTKPVKIFGNVTTAFGTVSHPLTFMPNIRRSSQRNPSVGG